MESAATPRLATPLAEPAVEDMLLQILQAVQASSENIAEVRRECEELRRANARLECQLVHHAQPSTPPPVEQPRDAPAPAAKRPSLPDVKQNILPGARHPPPSDQGQSPLSATSQPLSRDAKAVSLTVATPSPPAPTASTPASPVVGGRASSPLPSCASSSPFGSPVKSPFVAGANPRSAEPLLSASTKASSPARSSFVGGKSPFEIASTQTVSAKSPFVGGKSPSVGVSTPSSAARHELPAVPASTPSTQRLPPALKRAAAADDDRVLFCRKARGPYADLLRRAVC
ncbi:hypothetical protein BD626DRAFT_473441 [Schizophyllum amplum]|uniref:Uncharacterized protein n=1 Tax=Schizophyllum amplum TaxID=97359 RepID=A0A550CWT5_9AGAR|nr:hypothetical protein BD626DRAFT_473441 [Auriculariopsis ampla]